MILLMPRSHPHTGLVWSREPVVFFFISVRRKEKYSWLVRLPSHKENGLVNQVNLLGVAHTLTTSNDQNNLHNSHSKTKRYCSKGSAM